MSFLSDLRNSERLSQLLTVAGALVGFFLLAWLLLSSVVLYRVISPPAGGGQLTPESLLGHPSVVSFATPGGTAEGWFFPGRSTAPTVILGHGYLSQREEMLTLVTALQDHQYNVFVFDFSGHGQNDRLTTLGYRETKELLAAVGTIAARGDVDRTRFGVWGTNLGAYAALSAAASEPRIRAVVADSLYDDPMDLLNMYVESSGLNVLPLTPTLCRWGFRLMNFSDRNTLPLSQRMARLAGVPKLFIQANDNRPLADLTGRIYTSATEPRKQIVVPKSNYALMTNNEKRNYENEVVQFFLQYLPPAAVAVPPR